MSRSEERPVLRLQPRDGIPPEAFAAVVEALGKSLEPLGVEVRSARLTSLAEQFPNGTTREHLLTILEEAACDVVKRSWPQDMDSLRQAVEWLQEFDWEAEAGDKGRAVVDREAEA